jgi:hypothetical protein
MHRCHDGIAVAMLAGERTRQPVLVNEFTSTFAALDESAHIARLQ